MRTVFCGNFDFDTRQSDLERLFSRYGRINRLDMKSGFAFIYFEDEHDANDAIRALDGISFGEGRRRLSVEWSKGERGGPRQHDGSRSVASVRPTRTLFVINFDQHQTRTRDLERHFEPYGKIINVRIRRNFAFVQFETQEEATNAMRHTHMSKLLDRMVSVEYAMRDDVESPRRGDYGRRISPYGRSPSPGHRRGRTSPDYGRARSPDYGRARSPDYGRARSPAYGRYDGMAFNNQSPEYDHYHRRSPVRRSRT